MSRRSVLSAGLLALSACYVGVQDDPTGATASTGAASTGADPVTTGPLTTGPAGSTDMSAGTGNTGPASDTDALTSDFTGGVTSGVTTDLTTGEPGTTGTADTGEPPPDAAALRCERWKADRAQLGEGSWSGAVDACDPGTMSQDGRDNALRLVNLYRFIADLPPVTEDPVRTAKAQACALMMHANGQLNHTPPMNWKCWTADGSAAAGQSNISSTPGVLGVDLYMVDPGNDTTIGHRRWLLSNYLGPIGLGSTAVNSCLTVIGGNGNAGKPWLAWPPPGPVPYQALHVPTVPWSDVDQTGWTVQSDSIDLSAATVAVSVGGVDQPVAVNVLGKNYGSAFAIRFVPQGWTAEPGTTYDVALGNVAEPISYSVQIVDCP
jgi:hypothetical protein